MEDEYAIPIKTAAACYLREVHELNDLAPISATVSGMVTLDRLQQAENAPYPIEVTPFSMITVVRSEQLENT